MWRSLAYERYRLPSYQLGGIAGKTEGSTSLGGLNITLDRKVDSCTRILTPTEIWRVSPPQFNDYLNNRKKEEGGSALGPPLFAGIIHGRF